MKKLLILLIPLILSISAFAQLEIKQGSFKEIPGFVNTNQDPNYQTDDNELPFAIVKIITENLDNQQRRELLFEGNAATFFMLEYKPTEIWVYLTAQYADYLKISHPDYSTIEFQFPVTLKPNQGYEMVLALKEIPQEDNFGSLVLTTKPENDADIFIDGTPMNQKTPYTNELMPTGKYEITVSKTRFKNVTQTVEITADEKTNVVIEMPTDLAKITLKTDYDTDIYIDGEFAGKSTWCDDLISGNHEIVYKKQYHNDAKQTITVEAEKAKTYELKPTPICGKLNINSNPSGASVIIDGKNYGVTPVTLNNVIIGTHVLRVENETSSSVETFTLDESNTLNINAKLETGRKISFSTNEKDDMIYVDGKYFGKSPLSAVLSVGEHEVAAVRGAFRDMSINLDDFRDSQEVDIATKNITVETTGGTTSVKLEIDLLSKKTFTVNGVSFEMIGVKGGTFIMGEGREKHTETVSDFYIGKFEVTQKLWKAVMGKNPSKYWISDNLPVEYVSFDDCQEFVKKLNQLTGLSFRIPTVAEWDFAAQGGYRTHGFKFSGSNNSDDVSWSLTTANYKGVQIVGTKLPNELGIYDMSGNVCEWCFDDGRHPGTKGILGGAHDYQWYQCDIIWQSHMYATQNKKDDSFGLRLAIDK